MGCCLACLLGRPQSQKLPTRPRDVLIPTRTSCATLQSPRPSKVNKTAPACITRIHAQYCIMTSSDVRSILSLPQAGSTISAPRKIANLVKRPEGISRELYALIGNNAPSLAEAQASVAAVKYRDRPKVKTKKVKW